MARRTRTTKVPVQLKDGSILLVDSGQVSAFRQAEHQKPKQMGLIKRITDLWLAVVHRSNPVDTTEQGAAGAASPSTYELTLNQQRFERRQKIADCRQMVEDDPRARRATIMFAREAVRKGCTITVDYKLKQRLGKTKGMASYSNMPTIKQSQKAQEIADKIQEIVNPKLFSWAWMLLVEGDLFIQAIVNGDEVVGAKRMPGTGMERLTDDTDEFIDPLKAFAQVDVTTNEDEAVFPLALMHHERWNHIDGERYGDSELIAGRRMRRILELQEEAQAVRRMTRATQRILWNVGTAEQTAEPEEVDAFKEINGFVEGTRELWDPTEVSRDFFANGMVDAKVIGGDSGVSDVEDLKFFQNIYTSASLPTPSPLYNLDSSSVNRDVLDDLRAEWLKQTVAMSDQMAAVVRFLMNLGLLLAGILPETVDYNVHFSESTLETPSDIVDRILKLRTNQIGGQPDPLITRRHSIQLLAEIIDIDDVDSYMESLEIEDQQFQMKQLQLQTLQNKMQQEMMNAQQGLEQQHEQDIAKRVEIDRNKKGGGGAPQDQGGMEGQPPGGAPPQGGSAEPFNTGQ